MGHVGYHYFRERPYLTKVVHLPRPPTDRHIPPSYTPRNLTKRYPKVGLFERILVDMWCILVCVNFLRMFFLFADSIIHWLSRIEIVFQVFFSWVFFVLPRISSHQQCQPLAGPTGPPTPFDTTEDHSPATWKNSTPQKKRDVGEN